MRKKAAKSIGKFENVLWTKNENEKSIWFNSLHTLPSLTNEFIYQIDIFQLMLEKIANVCFVSGGFNGKINDTIITGHMYIPIATATETFYPVISMCMSWSECLCNDG